jgi:hypothetical protein
MHWRMPGERVSPSGMAKLEQRWAWTPWLGPTAASKHPRSSPEDDLSHSQKLSLLLIPHVQPSQSEWHTHRSNLQSRPTHKHTEPGELYNVASVSTSHDTRPSIIRVSHKYQLSITQILHEKWT